jgi:hypothetical protein
MRARIVSDEVYFFPKSVVPTFRTGADARWIDAAAIAMFVLIVRLPGFPASSLDWDESCYVLLAQQILSGHIPYVTMFDQKPLGAPLLFAFAMGLFGKNLMVIRLLGAISVLATCLMLRSLASLVGLSRMSALGTALLYGSFSTQCSGLQGTNIEILIAPFTTGAFLIAFRNQFALSVARRTAVFIVTGVLFGIAIQLKYLPVISAAAMYLALVTVWLATKSINFRSAILLGCVFGGVCLLPTISAVATYWWLGHLDEFLLANFGFMPSYVRVVEPFSAMVPRIIHNVAAISLLIVLAGTAVVRKSLDHRTMFIVILWLIAEAVALAAPWKFWDHYFLLLLPPLCLLAGSYFDSLMRSVAACMESSRKTQIIVLRAVMTAVILAPLVDVASWIIRGDLQISQPDMPRQVAEVLQTDTLPGKTVWVVDYKPIIYFLSGIDSPTRFPFPPSLVGSLSSYNGSHPDREVRRILAMKPTYLIISSNWEIILPELRPVVTSIIDKHYQLFRRITENAEWVEIYRRRSEESLISE